MRVLCQWQRTWFSMLLQRCTVSTSLFTSFSLLLRSTEAMQKCLDGHYASSRSVFQVTDWAWGPSVFSVHSKQAMLFDLRGDNASSFKLLHCKHFWLSLTKERVRSSMLGTPGEACRSGSEPGGGLTSQTHDAWPFGETLVLWDMRELPMVDIFASNNIKNHIH